MENYRFSLKQVDCDSNISFLNTMVSNTPGSSYSVKHTQNFVKTFGRNNSDIGCKPTEHVRRKDDADKSRCLKIIDLPSKIMERILRYLPFDNIAKLRLVSKYFNKVCSMMLSSEFFRLRAFMFHRLQTIKAQMPRRESARRKHPLARENEIIEALHARLSLLHMTFGNHIEKNHCCFFPGEIIDEVYRILKFIRNTSNLNEVYNITDELFDLSTMAMEYFKEHIEPALPGIKYFVTDLLECPSVNILSRTSSAKALIAKSSACKVPVHQKSNSFSTLKEHMISTYKLAKR
ncbi:F-box only protein 28-like isoform X2 [Stegodyphus dumicola]|uniref:F-box only protein 28-like isoform X2 n=1 Tax=Stegodyphus dumicola TaxID=202533 RepID=UPI0015B300D0|nr:F-box only protein 28-like isoform X2 [Stegodyphus dumicola]